MQFRLRVKMLRTVEQVIRYVSKKRKHYPFGHPDTERLYAVAVKNKVYTADGQKEIVKQICLDFEIIMEKNEIVIFNQSCPE